jgi:hypothetical protein
VEIEIRSLFRSKRAKAGDRIYTPPVKRLRPKPIRHEELAFVRGANETAIEQMVNVWTE